MEQDPRRLPRDDLPSRASGSYQLHATGDMGRHEQYVGISFLSGLECSNIIQILVLAAKLSLTSSMLSTLLRLCKSSGYSNFESKIVLTMLQHHGLLFSFGEHCRQPDRSEVDCRLRNTGLCALLCCAVLQLSLGYPMVPYLWRCHMWLLGSLFHTH